MAFDRSKYREELARQVKESIEMGGSETNFKYFKADGAVPLWSASPTDGNRVHIIDIIPFLAGNNYPQADKKLIKEGTPRYVMRVFVHTNVGPNKMMIVCPRKNYGLRCPICENADERNNRGEDYVTMISPIAAKLRCVYNIVCYDTKEEEGKGIQIFEGGYKFTEEKIAALGQSARSDETIAFADPENGRSISFSVAKDTYKTPSGHKLEPRDYKISDELLQAAYSLDQLLVFHSYEKIRDIYDMGAAVEESGPDNPKNYQQEDSVADSSRFRGNREKGKDPEASTITCPALGGTFGTDYGKLDPCLECEFAVPCEEENIKTKERKKETGTRRAR